MQVTEIIARAQEAAGFDGSVNHSYLEGLQIIVGDCNRSKHLTPMGDAGLAQVFTGLLTSRFKIDRYVSEHPEVLQEKIVRPVIIVGATRTGSTLASYLLGTDQRRRSLLKWESVDGIPPATTATLRTDPRCLAMKASEALALVPDADKEAAEERKRQVSAIHHEDADGPTECTTLLAYDFWSAAPEAMHPVPSYRDWLLFHKPDAAYAVHKKMLQILQSKAPGTWNLKGPTHSLGITTMLATYPDARVIWTHRDPYKVMGSQCNLIRVAHAVFGTTGTGDYIADHYPRQIQEHIYRPMAAEIDGKLHAGNCYHLFYADMMRDPVGQMRKLYAWLGDDFTADVEAGMRAYLAARPKNVFGKHAYSLESVGLSVDRLRPYFDDYLARYPVEMEGDY